MINFKVNGKILASFKYFILGYMGMYFLRLVDLEIVSSTGMVYPFYKPLLFIEKRPGQLILNITKGESVFSLVFQKTTPFLAFETAKLVIRGTEKEKEEG